MANVPTSISYVSDGAGAAWFIPFPVPNEGAVGVRVATPDGLERDCVLGRDYILSNGSVIMVAPAGYRVIIWLKGSVSEALASHNSQGAGPVAQPLAQVEPVAVAAPVSVAAYDPDELRVAVTGALADIEAAGNAQAESLGAMASGLDPLCRATQEAAAAAAGARVEAAENAGRAQAAMRVAAKSAEEASAAAASIAGCNVTLQSCASEAQAFAGASRASADEAYRASVNAWRAAAQCSVHHRRPGISAVARLEDIACCSPGLYMVNPHLVIAPTPFMGIWPADCVANMQWDGVFFIGPAYPAEVCMPPKPHIPVRPEPELPDNAGNADDWLPCDHNHIKRCLCGG